MFWQRVIGICGLLAVMNSAPEGAVYRVPGAFESVGAAVEAAGPGDTVRVGPGTYRVSVVLPRLVHLVGAGPDSTVLEGGGGDTVLVVLEDSYVAGLTVRGGETGVLVRAGGALEISDCRVADNSSDGIGFETDARNFLMMRGCEITRNGDGVDLEATQGVIRDCRFVNNADDGLDYDGDAGVLVYRSVFSDNGDDGIEIRLARRAHAIVLACVFERNGEDGIEIIDAPEDGGEDNLLSVQRCVFRNNRRYGVGFVDQESEEAQDGKMVRTSVYAAENTFEPADSAGVSPNYVSVFEASATYAGHVRATVDREGRLEIQDLPVRLPVLVGVYDLNPAPDGTRAEDLEGVTVHGGRVYVTDDNAKQVYVLDRRTGAVVSAIPTSPFTGDTRQAIGPEGLDITSRQGEEALLLADDDGQSLFWVSLQPGRYGQVLERLRTDLVGPVEGAEALEDRLILASNRNHLFQVDGTDLSRVGPLLRVELDGFGEHIAGVGADEADRRVFVTLSAYAKDQNWRNHRGGFFEMDAGLTEVLGVWHLGPFSNDPRGIAAADGLVYVADGRAPFRDEETGEMNRGGLKVFVFLLEEPGVEVERVLPLLPLRRDGK